MDLTAVRAFDILLRKGAELRQIDEFLSSLGVPQAASYEQALQSHFAAGCKFRDQIPFLKELYRTGMFVERCAGSPVAFIFFTSIIDPMGVTAARAHLSRLGANCIYLYDDRDMNYAFGIRQIGGDERALSAILRDTLSALGAKQVITVGCSAAGFAAIKHAVYLGAHGSVTFAPFTTFAEEHYHRDRRGQGLIERFRKLCPSLLIDLGPLIANSKPPLSLICFYAKGMALDAWHATRILKTGPRSLYAVGVRGNSHQIFNSLIARGVFDVVMKPLAQGASIAECIAPLRAFFDSEAADPAHKADAGMLAQALKSA